MTTLAWYELPEGGKAYVQVEDEGGGLVKARSAGEYATQAQESFDDALAAVRPTIDTLMGLLRALEDPPKETELEFALGLHIKAGAFIASTEAEANFKVRLSWQRDDPKP